MIRLSASLSRKVPIAGVEFSSQQFGASMEVEVGDTDRPEAIQQRLRELYQALSAAIEEQISAAGQEVPSRRGASTASATNGNGRASKPARSNGREVKASAAQVRAIKAIAAEQELTLAAVLAPYRVNAPEELSIRDASRLIDDLKARKGNGNRH